MNPPPNAQLIAYLRVSAMGKRVKDDASFHSFKQQRAANDAIVSLTPGATIVDEVEAPNASGGKSWPEPRLAEAIERVDRGEADGIVVYSLDRWGRSLQALEVIERWADEGKVFLSASEKFDVTTAAGRMALRMMMVVARYYWESTRDRFTLSQRDAIERGAFVGPTPFGYVRRDGRLYEHPKDGAIVREAFRIAARDGIHAAAAHLETHAPDKRWRTDDVRRVLSSRVYLGESRLARKDGELVNREAHAPLTTLPDWMAAQTEPAARRSNGDYPLSHIATCGRCGAGMVGALQTVRGVKYRRMRCSSACKGGCSIGADGLEAFVRATVAARLGNAKFRLLLEPVGKDDAEEALAAAVWDREQFLLGTSGLTAEAIATGARVRQDAVDAAEERLRAVAETSARREELPAAGELEDPEQLLRAVRAGVVGIVVHAGRGPVEDRVDVVFVGDELDERAGMLAA